MSRLHKTLGDKVFAELEDDILQGRLVPGSRLDEPAISKRFDVSRTPAREALRLLEQASLVRMIPRQGAVVRMPSAREYVAMMEILVELEALAARLASRRMNAAERVALAKAFTACEAAVQAQSRTDYGVANTLFHDTLYRGSRNEMLAEQIRTLRRRISPFRSKAFDNPSRLAGSCAEHAEVLAAVLAGDEDATQKAMRKHISFGSAIFADLISSLDEPPADAAR